MSKVIKGLTILWHSVKTVLHLTGKKDKVDKMEEVEKKFKG